MSPTEACCKSSRRELHAQIVDAIEALHHNRLGEHIELLAHHALRGELREKAVSYLRQAALKSVERSALHDAKAWFEQALGVLQALPESQPMLRLAFEIRLELRPVLMQLGDAQQMVQRLREAEILADRLSDDRLRVRAGSFLTSIQAMLGELDKSLVTGIRALEIAGSLKDWKLNMPATISLGQVHYLRGDYGRTANYSRTALRQYPRTRSTIALTSRCRRRSTVATGWLLPSLNSVTLLMRRCMRLKQFGSPS